VRSNILELRRVSTKFGVAPRWYNIVLVNLPRKEFLDPGKPLVGEVVGWLCGNGRFGGRLETVDGARSLAHVMVVVPTAQSGRNLRLALAKEAARRGWGGLLPPQVVLPMQLVRPADAALREATGAEVEAAFLKFVEQRPARHVVDGRGIVLDEWTHLFRPEAIEDMDARLSLLDQLRDIWRVLAGGGLIMSDVLQSEDAHKMLEDAASDEVSRWEELSELERAFFDFLHDRGLRYPSECVRLAKRAPRKLPTEIQEVVLPALADPIGVLQDVLTAQDDTVRITVLLHAAEKDAARFDDFGRPIVSRWTGNDRPVLERLDNDDIVLSSDAADLARRVAADFPAVGSGFALPSLALADDEAFPEVAAAFLNAGYVVHNPECHKLAVSSLGRLVQSLSELYRMGIDGLPWKPFVAVLRSNDFLSAVRRECPVRRSDILKGIDFVQNRFLPQAVPVGCAFPEVEISKYDKAAYEAFLSVATLLMDWLEAARTGHALVPFLRQMLKRIFAGKTLRGGDGEVEFREAAACLWDVLDGLESETIASLELPDAAFGAVVRRALGSAAYSLEPDSPDVVKTEGWLELAWSDCSQFALVGLHEGTVPDSVIGHPFLPDRLRTALGLTSNEQRLARDTWLLAELLESHAPHAVRAYVARTNSRGDICRPSRLLYLCSEAEFPKRVGYLFGDCNVEAERFPRQVADRWRLRLPDEIGLPSRDGKTPEGRLSASAIDQYVRCPFTYLLKFALGMKKVEEKTELGFDDFGTLVHKVLEEYAREQIARGDDQLTDAASIRSALDKIVARVREPYGPHPSVNVALQLDAVAGRIALFADIQAMWAAEGWRIVERPEYPFLVQPFADEGEPVWIKGSVDRIDQHPDFGYRIIDYKSWDKKDEVTRKHIAAGGAAQSAFAASQRLPTLDDGRRLLTVQLPLYARCLECADAKFRGKVADMCYLVLGQDADNVGVYGSCRDQGTFKCQKKGEVCLAEISSVALATARTAVRHIRGNLFWPPGPGKEWRYDIKDLVVTSPEKDMGEDDAAKPAWLAKQLERLEACV